MSFPSGVFTPDIGYIRITWDVHQCDWELNEAPASQRKHRNFSELHFKVRLLLSGTCKFIAIHNPDKLIKDEALV